MKRSTLLLVSVLSILPNHSSTWGELPRTLASDQETTAQLVSILERKLPMDSSESAKDELAQQQAEAGAKLLKLGKPDSVWPLLRQSGDNSLRTYLIYQFAQRGIDPAVLIKQLEIEKDVSVRRALILSLGGFTGDQISPEKRRPLIQKLLLWYRVDPDPGVHSAIDWLLRNGSQGQISRKLDWHQASALAAIDRTLSRHQQVRGSWYVTKEEQTMSVLREPLEYLMGSPMTERGRVSASDSPDEPQRRVRISRSFAIATKDVTISQFRRFLAANPDIERNFVYSGNPSRMATVLATFSPEEGGPQIAMTWYEAAMYCNWLSMREGIPKSEWVYPTSSDQIKDGMELRNDYLHKTGYRLPTEAEWEYAARAGSTTSRFFGTSDEMLQEYAWYSKHPPKHKNDPADPADPQRTWPVAELKPNDFGLFDAYGNVWNWCQDRLQELQPNNLVSEDHEDDILLVTDKVSRTRRGGSFPYEANMMRSAGRDTRYAFPMFRRDNVGFRVARTYR